LWRNLKERDSLEVLGVDERIILKRILKNQVDWTHLAEDMDKWQAFVNAVMNLRVP
jgi:hypothetical protein